MKYKAFISYSHTHRVALASALETALHRFGIPAHLDQGLHFFRDSTNLSASPELWPDIERALDDSEYFILVGSPEAAASPWVQKEVAHWRTHREAARMILLLADGEIAWATGDFDFSATTALPRTISGAFASVPFWVDFRRILPAQLDVSDPAFCDGVATIAARLQGRGKDELIGIYVANRIATEAERLAAQAELALRDEFPQRSILLSAAALRLTHERGLPRVPAAEETLRSALSCFGGRPLGDVRSSNIDPPAAFSADDRWLAAIGTDGNARLWSLENVGAEPEPVILRDKAPLQKLMFAGNPRWLITAAEPQENSDRAATTLRAWDAKASFENWHDLAGSASAIVTCSIVNREGTHVAAQFGDDKVRVWELPAMDGAGAPKLLVEIATGEVTALAFMQNPLRLIAGARDGAIRVWIVAKPRKPALVLDSGGAVATLAASPTGSVLAALASGKPPQLWSLAERDPQASRGELPTGDARFFHLRFSPKGTWLLCLGDDSYAIPFAHLEPGSRAFELTATGGRIWKHSFSADERWLATATGLLAAEELAQAIEPEYDVRLWDLGRGHPWFLPGHTDIVTDVAFTPDGKRVIGSSLDRTIRIWDCTVAQKFQAERLASRSENSPPGGLDQHEAEHTMRAFSKPAVRLAADDQIFDCIPSPGGLWLLTLSRGASTAARLWLMIDEPFPAAPLFIRKERANLALALPHPQRWLLFSELARASNLRTGFSKANRWFFLQTGEASVRLYDLRTNGAETIDLTAKGEKITWAWWSPDERWFLATSETPGKNFFELRLWDLSAKHRGATAGVAVESPATVPPALFNPDSRWLLCLQGDAALLCDLTCDAPLRDPRRVPGTTARVSGGFRVDFSPCGRWLINAANPEAVWLHDLRHAGPLTPVAILPVAGSSIEMVCAAPAGRLVFAAGPNDFARVWRVSDDGAAEPFMEIRGHEKVEKAVFSTNDRWLVTRDFEAIQLWDLEARERRCVIPKQQGDVRLSNAVVFLAQDRWVVISKWRAIFLIDLSTPERAASPIALPGHDFENVGFWFTPDHRWLITADFPLDELRGRGPRPAVRLWDLRSPIPETSAVRLPGLDRGVSRINVSTDGRWLSTASDDGVRLWPLGTAHLLEIAGKTVGRDFTEDECRRYRVPRSTPDGAAGTVASEPENR